MGFLEGRIRNWLRTCTLVGLLCVYGYAGGEDDLKSLVERAFEFHQQGQFSAALPLLRRAYVRDPNDYFVNLLLGIDSLRTGESKASIPFLKRASRLRPGEEYPLAYLGEAYAREQSYGDAAEAYIKAVQVAPHSPETSIALVDFALSRFADVSTFLRGSNQGLAAEYRLRALAMGRDDATRRGLLERAADLDPAARGIFSDLAEASFAAGDLARAKSECQRALAADPNDLSAWLVRAQLAGQSGDWKQTSERLNRVAQRSPAVLAREVNRWPLKLQPPTGAVTGSAAKFFSCVRAQTACAFAPTRTTATGRSSLFREQRWEQLTKLPTPLPGRTEAWFERGVALAQIEDCPHAIPSLERGVTRSSPGIYGFFLLSWCYSREAGRVANEVQQSGNDEASLHIMRGDILLRVQSKAEMAVSEYEQALARDPHDPAVLERLAEAQLGAGQTDVAREDALAALRIDPQRLGATRTLARIASDQRDYATALPYLRELVARNPQDLTGRVELGRACAQTGALEEARQNLGPALADGYPDEKGTLHYLLGSVLKKMGRTADAEQAFATATRLSDAFQQKSYRDLQADAQP